MAVNDKRGGSAFLYDAFISYRHTPRDRKWAEWLIAALESYRLPKALQDRGLPPRLGKIFRDEDEVAASPDLNEHIKEALAASRFLIVVCSAFTPRSKWVAREIEIFNELGRSDQVLALLTEGEPGDSFPTVLLERHRLAVEADGSAQHLKEEREPVAADVRPRPGVSSRQVERFALLRLVARILDVSFDDLRQREQERQHRRRLAWAAAAAALCLVVSGAVFGYWQMMRPQTSHYRHLVWRWALPEGLDPIDAETRDHLMTSYGVTVRRGSILQWPRVVEVRRETSSGGLNCLCSVPDTEDEQARWVVHYREDGSPEKIEAYDATNELVRESVLRSEPSTGKLIVTFQRGSVPLAQAASQNLMIDPLISGQERGEAKGEITRHELTFDESGWTIERRYQDSWGTPRHDAEASFGERLAYTPDGLVLRRAKIGPDGAEITPKNGVRAVTFAYDQHHNLVRHALIGFDERPITGPSGFAYFARKFDRWGQDTETSYFAPDGKPTLHKDGYAGHRQAFDGRGNVFEFAYVGIDGHPTLTKRGYALERQLFDARGNRIEVSYFDADGKPTQDKDGFAKQTSAFDARGNEI